MPPKRKRRGKKRKTTSKKRKTTMRQRLSAAADYARGHPGTIAGYAAGAGLSAAALNELQLAARRGYKARKNKTLLAIKEANLEPEQKKQLKALKAEQAALASPIYGGYKRGRKTLLELKEDLEDFSKVNMETKKQILSDLSTRQIKSIKDAAEQAYDNVKSGGRSLRERFASLFKNKNEKELDWKNDRKKIQAAMNEAAYGKRRRRKRRKSSFGKKSKKPSAATRRMCKKLKVRMTLKRGKKRVYKSESMLKKQCKKAMKRRKKK